MEVDALQSPAAMARPIFPALLRSALVLNLPRSHRETGATRLHEPIKSIPVLDPGSGRAKFVGAPGRYQMPMRVLATTLKDRRELNASLILDKQGIVRIEYHANGNR